MKKKKKSRALVRRGKGAMTVRRKGGRTSGIPKQDTLALVASKTLGVKIISHKDYFRPVMTNAQILWVKFRDKKTGLETETPFVPYDPILDNLHRRGVQSIAVEPMIPLSCKEAGCYNHSPGDLMHRCKATITLRNGQVFIAEGDACVHNTSSIAKKSLRRVAETRAKARAGRDAVNIGVPCIVEVLPYEGQMRVGDRVMSQQETDRVVMGEVVQEKDKNNPTEQQGRPVMGTPTGTQTDETKQLEHKDEWTKANARLHAEAHRLKLDTELLHKYIHGKENVKSIKEVPAEKLADYADNLKGAAVGSSGHQMIVAELEKMKEAA